MKTGARTIFGSARAQRPCAGISYRLGLVGGKPSALVLGDNIFYRHGLPELLVQASARDAGATVFGYFVRDPAAYGVVSFDA